MKRSPKRDLTVGLFVLVGLACILVLSFDVGGQVIGERNGLDLIAHFDELGGLKTRSVVTISGVKVGQVSSISLDEDYRAQVVLDLEPDLKLPTDTSASIVTAGLLGDRYVILQPGAEDNLLRPGDTITFTESAVLLERLIGKLVHNADLGEGK